MAAMIAAKLAGKAKAEAVPAELGGLPAAPAAAAAPAVQTDMAAMIAAKLAGKVEAGAPKDTESKIAVAEAKAEVQKAIDQKSADAEK